MIRRGAKSSWLSVCRLICALTVAILVAWGASALGQAAACTTAINTTPETCATGPWLEESGKASKAGYGNFWPPECGPPGPPPEYLIEVDNLCGCVEEEPEYYQGLGHLGCKPGPNEVSSVFETVPWCYVQNGIVCPAAFSAGVGKPLMRQCSGTIPQTGQGNAMGDRCQGESCKYPTFRALLELWAKPAVLDAFESSGVLETVTEAGPIGGCDGPKCKSFTMVLPLWAGKEGGEVPAGTDLEQLARAATGYGVAYAGELFDGRTWYTLGNTVTTARLPSCPNVAAAAFYEHGFPTDAGGTSNVPPTPCISVAPCISEIVYGAGVNFDDRRVEYWVIANEAIVYFVG
jgi:hypothetical protein